MASSNAVGTSPYAGPVSLATYAYAAPTGLSWNAAPPGNEIDLSWVNNTSTAASITIQRATGAADSESSAPAGLVFCCDQDTIYDPSRDLFIWGLMYSNNGLTQTAEKIAVAHGASGVASGTWLTWTWTCCGA